MSESLAKIRAFASKSLCNNTLEQTTYSGHSDGHECPSYGNAVSTLRRVAHHII